VFTDPSGKWKIHVDNVGGEYHHILHHHYERSHLKAMSRGVDHYWAWCYSNGECSECDSTTPDEVKGLAILLSMKGDIDA
jgi:hypothetical protein